MPLILDDDLRLSLRVEILAPCASLAGRWSSGIESVDIALVNNMPDSVLEETESQFLALLQAAADGIPVRLKLFALPGFQRGHLAQQRIRSHYSSINVLWDTPFDALIVTGTEPCQLDLRQEPYWPALTDILTWAEETTFSTVLSCLAAHAGVLHFDGVAREPLCDKRFGVFDFDRSTDHALVRHLDKIVRFPHSRWNEIRAGTLLSSGYQVLTQSAQAGVDLFVKERNRSLFVNFQGHPEYGVLKLLAEYRRDTIRFLKGERQAYPSMPLGYFDPAAQEILDQFQKYATVRRSEEMMAHFPEAEVTRSLRGSWESSAVSIYRNWLEYVASMKAKSPRFAAMSRIGATSKTVECINTV